MKNPRALAPVAAIAPSATPVKTSGAARPVARLSPTPRPAAEAAAAKDADLASVQGLSLPFTFADNAAANRLFSLAIAGSLLLHGFVFALKFQPLFVRHNDQGPLLEVALVNAKSTSKPVKPEVLAQANLDGGGNTDANRHAKTPLPFLPREQVTGDVAVAAKKVEALEQQTQEMLAQLKATQAAVSEIKPVEIPEDPPVPRANEMMQKTLEAMRMEAQISRKMDMYEKRPRRQFIGSRAAEYRFARYVEDWRLKVERIGNLNYPELARQQKIYGDLVVNVSIRADGSLESAEITRSSGHKILDTAAIHIIELSAPYAPFPPDIRRDTDIINITRTWTFTRGDGLVGEQ